ncbi:porin [Ideonella dechloratans]|uniref:porin n=1 Tax=Ideonella dechloratans TaxID=36863 RepID=UPI0035B15738
MKKSLVLTAIAATLAAPAFAQSSVTIYGRLNLSVESTKIDGAGKRDWQEVDNSSRIGFAGEEDLGGGNKAIFKIESGFDASQGTAKDRFWGRESTVGLATRYGTVKLGNLDNNEAYHATADYVSWVNHDTGTTSDFLYGGGLHSNLNYWNSLQNAVSYNTPDLNGFVGWVQTAEAYGGDKSKPLAVGAYYDRGALHLGFGFDKHGDAKSTAVRANYDLGAFAVGAYFNVVRDATLTKYEDDGVTIASQATGVDYNTWRLVGSYTLGANEFHLNYGGTNNVKTDLGSANKAWQVTAGYNYNLSKRTKVYAFVTKMKDDDAVFSPNTSATSGTFNTYGAGIRHNF